MDLIAILRARVGSLEEGPYIPGLRAVLQHVEVASKHFIRGSQAPDDTAFTDAIYRTNQAFEGSLKEAFRVLAGKDPAKVTPFEIEIFFQNQSILRSRVLEQMSRYRKEWRNPSTHDYQLDFDEDEALLAIVSVCAFAIVLIDQITEKLSFERAKAAAEPQVLASGVSLADAIAAALTNFRFQSTSSGSGMPTREVELIGALAGYLETTIPGTIIMTEVRLRSDGPERADILAENNSEKVILEVKKMRSAQTSRTNGLTQVSRYTAMSGIRDAILYIFTDNQDVENERKDYYISSAHTRIITIGPKTDNNSA